MALIAAPRNARRSAKAAIGFVVEIVRYLMQSPRSQWRQLEALRALDSRLLDDIGTSRAMAEQARVQWCTVLLPRLDRIRRWLVGRAYLQPPEEMTERELKEFGLTRDEPFDRDRVWLDPWWRL